MFGLAVPVFGVATGAQLGVLADAWLLASIVLTAAAAAVLALVVLRYVDDTALRGPWLWLARLGVPLAAVLMPAGFFLSVASPDATEPNALIALVPAGGVLLLAGVLTAGIGLLRDGNREASVLTRPS